MTDSFMPIVQPETCFAIEEECKDLTDKETVNRLFKKLKKNNPVVAAWIKRWSNTTKDSLGAMACALIAYRLLESQSEADFMNEIYDLE